MANEEQLRLLKQGVDAWNEWRVNHENVKIDLSFANFISPNYIDAGPISDNLIGANLGGANLIGATLGAVNLTRANLIGADLGGANLIAINLIGANLTRANLAHANLTDVKLSEADFHETILYRTALSDANLSEAKNLNSCRHDGHSFIDRNTYIRSGPLPKEFLQGCGLPDWEIEATKLYNQNLTDDEIIQIQQRIYELRTSQPIQYYSCFISYSHADKAFAQQLHDRLQQEGIRVWLDEHQLLPGDDIYDRIEHGIRLWDKVLLCCSQEALCSWWVDNEIDLAFEKERQLMKERQQKVLALIPLNLDGYMFSDGWKSGKKRQVLSRVATDFVGWDKDEFDFGRRIEKVIKALRLSENTREKSL